MCPTLRGGGLGGGFVRISGWVGFQRRWSRHFANGSWVGGWVGGCPIALPPPPWGSVGHLWVRGFARNLWGAGSLKSPPPPRWFRNPLGSRCCLCNSWDHVLLCPSYCNKGSTLKSANWRPLPHCALNGPGILCLATCYCRFTILSRAPNSTSSEHSRSDRIDLGTNCSLDTGGGGGGCKCAPMSEQR